MSNSSLQQITDILLKATVQIEDIYFQLPVAGLEDPEFRERVYCYELYHQMRLMWPKDLPYRITGEIDKGGHPWIYRDELNRSKPDFTVHVPGRMSDNLLVIEVKSPEPTTEQIVIDLRKLTGYCKTAGYFAAYYLVYGCSVEQANEISASCIYLATKYAGIDLTRIKLLTHASPNSMASIVPWSVV